MKAIVNEKGPVVDLRIKTWLELGKSGIVILVLVTASLGYLAGFPLESSFSIFRFLTFHAALGFLSLGASALNQIQERSIDAKMDRTRGRPLPSGKVSLKLAKFFSFGCIALGLLGLSVLSWNLTVLGLLAVLSYNGLYTLWWKPKMAFGAIPGAIPGALPIWMGYVAATDQLWNPAGIYLFAILFFWQMPHFWILAVKYSEDYARGGIPTLPVALGNEIAFRHILLWSLGYGGLLLLAPLFFPVRWLYLGLAILTLVLLVRELRLYSKSESSRAWLRFFLCVNFSLVGILCALVADLWSIYALIPLKTR